MYIHEGGFTYGYGHGTRLNGSKVVDTFQNMELNVIGCNITSLSPINTENF